MGPRLRRFFSALRVTAYRVAPLFPGTTRSFVVGSCSHSLTRGLSDHPLSEKLLLLYGVRVARKFHTLTAHQRTQVPDFNGVDHCWAFIEERLTPSLGVTVCCLTGINAQLSTGYPCKEQLSEVVWATATTCRKSWSCRTFKMAKITDFFLKHLLELDLMTLGGALMKVSTTWISQRKRSGAVEDVADHLPDQSPCVFHTCFTQQGHYC